MTDTDDTKVADGSPPEITPDEVFERAQALERRLGAVK